MRPRRQSHLLAAVLVAAWVAIVVLPLVSQYGSERAAEKVRTDRVLARATRDVRDVLDLIGHGVAVDEVALDSSDEMFTAGYSRSDRRIAVNPGHGWEDGDLLFAMAHECVHALFHQVGVLPDGPETRDHVLVEETAAYVLGAHLAGEVITRRGGDGEAFAAKEISDYRARCDQESPENAMRAYLRDVEQRFRGGFDPAVWYQIATHYGSGELVDGVSAVYRRHDDPWDAVQEIADTYQLSYE